MNFLKPLVSSPMCPVHGRNFVVKSGGDILTVEHFSFHAFYKKCGLQHDLMSCSSHLTLKRRQIFSCTFPFFEQATNLFNATGHHACSATSTKISIDILLPATKTFGLKLSQPTSRNDFNLFLVLVGGGCILSISSCCSLHTNPHRVVKGLVLKT